MYEINQRYEEAFYLAGFALSLSGIIVFVVEILHRRKPAMNCMVNPNSKTVCINNIQGRENTKDSIT